MVASARTPNVWGETVMALRSWRWLTAGFLLAMVVCLTDFRPPEAVGANPVAEAKEKEDAAEAKDDAADAGKPNDADAEAKDPVEKAPPPAVQVGFVPPDRSTLILLSRARALVDEGRHSEAARCIGTILEGPSDFFFQPDKSSADCYSLKSEAMRLLMEMPGRGREFYELQYGARARQMFDEAVAAGDVERIGEVSRRFFHTAAGYEAALLTGISHLDDGRPMAAALILQRLARHCPTADRFEPALSLTLATCWLRAGEPQKAQAVLSPLGERLRKGQVDIAGESVELFTAEVESLEWLTSLIGVEKMPTAVWLENWTMLHGNAARNAEPQGSGPLLRLRWHIPVTTHPLVQTVIAQLKQGQEEKNQWFLPALHPLVVGDTVLMRTAQNMVAIDFNTGKRLWEIPGDDPFEAVINPPANVPVRNSNLATSLRYRLWGDSTYGTLSSDGTRVFTIEDLPLSTSPQRQNMAFLAGMPGTKSATAGNRLTATNVRNGKLAWHVGGSAADYGLPLAETFFLGPPLPLMGRLYVLGEAREEVRLLALDAESGELLWEQPLSLVDKAVLNDPLRRFAGVSPSHCDGVLICPTSHQSVVAVELATRSLLWGYSYPVGDDSSNGGNIAMKMAGRRQISAEPFTRWLDSSVVIADGRVLFTPVDSTQLHCLDLLDGKLLWKRPRADNLYMACVHQGKVALVAQNEVRALRLDDGQPAWDGRAAKFPGGSVPSGFGFRSNGLYFVPLSSSQVMAVDLAQGGRRQLSKSHKQRVPGNLVCHQGMILSQNTDGLDVFHQLDALREQVGQRLEATPDDHQALTLFGEILWDEGRLDEAVERFRRSLALDASVETKQLLREALLEGLDERFGAYRQSVEELQGLIESPAQQALFWRLQAAGLEAAGEFPATLECLEKLIDLDLEHRALEDLDGAVSMRRDLWLRHRLAALRSNVPDDAAAAIDQLAQGRYEQAIAKSAPESLQQFLEYFGKLPIGEQARRQLADQLRESGQLLKFELLLARERWQGDPQRSAGALAELAGVLGDNKRWADAAACYATLGEDFADVVCRDGLTGRQLLDSLAEDDPLRKCLYPISPWPTGDVSVERSKLADAPPQAFQRPLLPYQGSRAPFYREMSIELRMTHPSGQSELVARDGYGEIAWTLAMGEYIQSKDFNRYRYLMRVNVCGHLLLVSVGNRILGVDGLQSSGETPRVLWSRELTTPDNQMIGQAQMQLQLRMMAMQGQGGLARFGLPNSQYQINVPVAVSERVICFKRFGKLFAIDPASGETLWMRHDVRSDSNVFGDHQYIFVHGPTTSKATVYDAQNGRRVGQRQIPSGQVATVGRRLLLWRPEGDKHVLEMVDPWWEDDESRRVWISEPFHVSTRRVIIDHELIGLIEPEGRFVLLGMDDGHPIIDHKLEPVENLMQFAVYRTPQQYLLVTNGRTLPDQTKGRYVSQLPNVTSLRIYSGRVHAFDLQGKMMWPKPFEITGHCLPTLQPSQLPVLTFAAQVRQQGAPGKPSSTHGTVLCLEKLTGEVLCDEKFEPSSNAFNVVGDPQAKTVEVRLQKDVFRLTFTTDPRKPRPERVEADEETEEDRAQEDKTEEGDVDGAATLRAILGALRGTLLEPAADDEPDPEIEPPKEKPAEEKPKAAGPALNNGPAAPQGGGPRLVRPVPPRAAPRPARAVQPQARAIGQPGQLIPSIKLEATPAP